MGSGTPAVGLNDVLDEHLRWMSRWQRAMLFSDLGQDVLHGLTQPEALQKWCEGFERADMAAQPVIDRLAKLHDDMHRLAQLLLAESRAGRRPSLGAYDVVMSRFDEFVTQLRRIERAFNAAASNIDPLTGLRNRADMMENLNQELNRFRRSGKPFCIALCDIDHFKSINDRFGHDTGDRVLAAVANNVNRNIRSFDDAYRIGGEEFLICLKDVDCRGGFIVIDRLRHAIQNAPMTIGDGTRLTITASFGLVQAEPGCDIHEQIRSADRALYVAKRSGRNRVVLGTPPDWYRPPPRPQGQGRPPGLGMRVAAAG